MEPLSLVDSIVVIAAIVGTTQAFKVAFPDRVQGIVTVLIAAVLGLLAGFGHVLGLSAIEGLFYGLSAVAAHTLSPSSK